MKIMKNGKFFFQGYKEGWKLAVIVAVFLMVGTRLVWAAEPPLVQKIRCSQTMEKVRIVVDMNIVPSYTVKLKENGKCLVIDLPRAVNSSGMTEMTFHDANVAGIHTLSGKSGLQLTVDLTEPAEYKVFTLAGPPRLVVDVLRTYKGNKETSVPTNPVMSEKQPQSEKKAQSEELAQGVRYYSQEKLQPFPLTYHVVEVAPNSPYTVEPMLSNDAVPGLETVLSMAQRRQALAAVNASYFEGDGTIWGLLKIKGEFASLSYVPRGTWGIRKDGKSVIDIVDYGGKVILPDGTETAICGINRERGTNELILYNHYNGDRTGTNNYGMEYVVSQGKVIGISGDGNTVIPGDCIILSAHGTAAQDMASLQVGDKLEVQQSLSSGWDSMASVLGAGPLLVQKGQLHLTTQQEEFGPDVAWGRAPRTALGIGKDGRLILVVVDGRQAHSKGLTLEEMGRLMLELGAVDAVNFDGGGSSEMVVQNRIVNSPSDGHERRVGDAIVVVSRLAN